MKTCKICKKQFTSKCLTQIVCGSVCAKENLKIKRREWRERNKNVINSRVRILKSSKTIGETGLINTDKIKIVHTDPKKWGRKHSLGYYRKKCTECDQFLELNQPAVVEGYVGFINNSCKCGSNMVRYYFKESNNGD